MMVFKSGSACIALMWDGKYNSVNDICMIFTDIEPYNIKANVEKPTFMFSYEVKMIEKGRVVNKVYREVVMDGEWIVFDPSIGKYDIVTTDEIESDFVKIGE